MKCVMLLAIMLLIPKANAAWVGKLDLKADPQAIGLRELHDGNWLAGVQRQIWHLEKDGRPLVHISFFSAWRAFQGDAAYGPALGINTGPAGAFFQNVATTAWPSLAEHTKWVENLSNWISLEAYSGYRPRHGPDTHSWIYGVGGVVRIPVDLANGL